MYRPVLARIGAVRGLSLPPVCQVGDGQGAATTLSGGLDIVRKTVFRYNGFQTCWCVSVDVRSF